LKRIPQGYGLGPFFSTYLWMMYFVLLKCVT